MPGRLASLRYHQCGQPILEMKSRFRTFLTLAIAFLATVSPGARAATPEGAALRDALIREAAQPGKPAWRPMLLYLAELHSRSIHPPLDYFLHPFESIGP